MDRYVEVIGEGQYTETAARFIAEVTLEVRAAKDETAFRELGDFCRDSVAVLRAAGLTDEEISEGGSDLSRPWYLKKQVGQSATRKVLLKVKDFSKLNLALERLEPLQSAVKDRKTIRVDMRQPEFDDCVEREATALTEAFLDARSKAMALVAVMKCQLGPALRVEEGGMTKRNSGFSGDEDWGGDSSRFGLGAVVLAAGGAGAAAQSLCEPELQRPTRTIFIKCRVRFAVEDAI